MRTSIGSTIAVLCAGPLSACAVLSTRVDSPKRVVRGPIPSRVQHPLAWTLMDFRPRRAATEEQGKFGLEVTSVYTSIFRNDSNAQSQVTIDGELWENALRARYGIAPHTDLEIEIPILFATAGFLDHFVDFWHHFFGFPNGLRDTRPDNAFEMDIHTEGHEVYHFDRDRPLLGDIPLVITEELIDEAREPLSLAVRGGVQLPTGSEEHGSSNGAWDWGMGCVLERSFERWTITAGADSTHSRTPSAFDPTSAGLVAQYDLELGGEYRWNDHVSLLTELVWTSPMTHDFALHVINRPILDLGVGAAWDAGEKSRWLVSFHEDLVSNTGPDFGLLVGWSSGW